MKKEKTLYWESKTLVVGNQKHFEVKLRYGIMPADHIDEQNSEVTCSYKYFAAKPEEVAVKDTYDMLAVEYIAWLKSLFDA